MSKLQFTTKDIQSVGENYILVRTKTYDELMSYIIEKKNIEQLGTDLYITNINLIKYGNKSIKSNKTAENKFKKIEPTGTIKLKIPKKEQATDNVKQGLKKYLIETFPTFIDNNKENIKNINIGGKDNQYDFMMSYIQDMLSNIEKMPLAKLNNYISLTKIYLIEDIIKKQIEIINAEPNNIYEFSDAFSIKSKLKGVKNTPQQIEPNVKDNIVSIKKKANKLNITEKDMKLIDKAKSKKPYKFITLSKQKLLYDNPYWDDLPNNAKIEAEMCYEAYKLLSDFMNKTEEFWRNIVIIDDNEYQNKWDKMDKVPRHLTNYLDGAFRYCKELDHICKNEDIEHYFYNQIKRYDKNTINETTYLQAKTDKDWNYGTTIRTIIGYESSGFKYLKPYIKLNYTYDLLSKYDNTYNIFNDNITSQIYGEKIKGLGGFGYYIKKKYYLLPLGKIYVPIQEERLKIIEKIPKTKFISRRIKESKEDYKKYYVDTGERLFKEYKLKPKDESKYYIKGSQGQDVEVNKETYEWWKKRFKK